MQCVDDTFYAILIKSIYECASDYKAYNMLIYMH